MNRLRIAGLIAMAILGGAACSQQDADPVAVCERAARTVWEQALAARTVADIQALPGNIPECRNLTASQEKELQDRNSRTLDRIAAHAVRVALAEEGEPR